MKILKELVLQYDNLKEIYPDEIPDFGFTCEEVKYKILISESGNLDSIIRIGSEKNGKQMMLPSGNQRNGDLQPRLFWDSNLACLFDLKRSSKHPDGHEFLSQLSMYEMILPDNHPVLLFYKTKPFLSEIGKKQLSEKMQDKDFEKGIKVLCNSDTGEPFFNDKLYVAKYREWLNERFVAIKQQGKCIWQKDLNKQPVFGTCSITGEKNTEICELFDKVKSFGQSSGSTLVSFDHDVCRSYGAVYSDKCAHLSISQTAMFKAITALNFMLRKRETVSYKDKNGDYKTRERRKYSVKFGDKDALVYWCSESSAVELLNNQFDIGLDFGISEKVETEQHTNLSNIAHAIPFAERMKESNIKSLLTAIEAEEAKVHLLKLRANAGRVSVDAFYSMDLKEMIDNLNNFQQSLKFNRSGDLTFYQILDVIAEEKQAGQRRFATNMILNSILRGTPLPLNLLYSAVIKSNKNHINYLKAEKRKKGLRHIEYKERHSAEDKQCAVMRSCLAQKLNGGIGVMLEKENIHPAYVLGRFFAACEEMNKRSNYVHFRNSNDKGDTKGTVYDKYNHLIVENPCFTLDKLCESLQMYGKRLRDEAEGSFGDIALKLDEECNTILSLLSSSGLPRRFNVEEKAILRIGYAHEVEYLKTLLK